MRDDLFKGLVLALLAVNLALGTWTLSRPLPTAVILEMATELGKRDAAILILQGQIQNLRTQPPLPVPTLPPPPGGKKK